MRTICALWTNRTGKRFPRAHMSIVARSSGDKTIGAALLLMHDSIYNSFIYVKLFKTHYTSGLFFAPDGNLYVSSRGTSNIKRYNGTTGAFINTFVPFQS